jgi:hypothetical protein
MNTLRGVVGLAAAAAAMGLTMLASTPANAAQAGYCGLQAKRAAGEYMNLILNCPPHSSGDQLYKIELWADDSWSDDRIHTYYANCDPRPVTMTIHENWLNEDLADRDEVYARAWYRKTNNTIYSIQSATNVTGWWGTRTVVERPSSYLC